MDITYSRKGSLEGCSRSEVFNKMSYLYHAAGLGLMADECSKEYGIPVTAFFGTFPKIPGAAPDEIINAEIFTVIDESFRAQGITPIDKEK